MPVAHKSGGGDAGWKDIGMEGWIACGICNMHLILEDAEQFGCCGRKYRDKFGDKRQREECEQFSFDETNFSLMKLLIKHQNWGSDPAEILPRVFLGSMVPSQDLKLLQKLRITHVLNMAEELPNAFPDKLVYMKLPLSDDPDTDIGAHFEATFEFISAATQDGTGILVHCAAGASRSVSVMLAYLMKAENKTFKEAFMLTKEKRLGICPNRGFLKQLLDFERSLFGSNSMTWSEASVLY